MLMMPAHSRQPTVVNYLNIPLHQMVIQNQYSIDHFGRIPAKHLDSIKPASGLA